jgi:hypothetical protein
MRLVLTTFTLIWLIGAAVGAAVYVWDWREARLDGQFLNELPPGATERRVRPQSHMIVSGDVRAAGLYLAGQFCALVVGFASLWVPNRQPAASNSGLTTRGLILIIGFIGLECLTSAGGVVRIYVRRWLRRRHATEVAAARINEVNPLPVVIADQIEREMETEQ